MATIPVTPPLVAVPAIVEVAIVAVVVPVRPVGSIGAIRAIGAVRAILSRAVGPVWTVGLLRARLVRAVPVRPVRSVRLIRTIGAVGPVPVRAGGAIGLLCAGTVWADFGPVRTVRTARSVRLLRAGCLRTPLIRGARRSIRTFAIGAGGARRTRCLRAIRAHFGARSLGPLSGRLLAAFCAMLRALARSVFGPGLPVLRQGRYWRERRECEAGDGGEHHQGTFHGLLPRTPRGRLEHQSGAVAMNHG
ncbi:hypothetical protein D3C87_1309630 [compost metagenome]